MNYLETDNLGPARYTESEKHVWNIIGAVALTIVVVMVKIRQMHTHLCKWCGLRHQRRPPKMTAEEFLRIYCGGWKAYNKMKDAGEISYQEMRKPE